MVMPSQDQADRRREVRGGTAQMLSRHVSATRNGSRVAAFRQNGDSRLSERSERRAAQRILQAEDAEPQSSFAADAEMPGSAFAIRIGTAANTDEMTPRITLPRGKIPSHRQV